MNAIQNLIGGKLQPALSGKTLPNFAPAEGRQYSTVAASDSRDVNQAVEAAQKAFPVWANTPTLERSRFLRKIAEAIRDKADEFVRAESLDTGKPLSVSASVDIPRSSSNFEFFADAITQFSSESHVTDDRALNYTLRSPLGVVGCISPWNLPLYLLSWKIAPALATGNTVVAKPSELTPMTAFLLSQVCQEVGLPPGVLNIVQGTGAEAGAALVGHQDVAAISFTGSTRTGAAISRAAAPEFKKISLEMGGKNPTIIFADCDLEEAVAQTVRSSFSNQGQICLCAPRIFVEKKIYSKFRDLLVEKTRQLRIGDPLDPATEQGAVVSQEHLQKVLSYIDLAHREGGKLLTGGKRAKLSGRCSEGWFIEPTLFEGLSPECQINQDEVFGPFAALIPFETEDEVLAWANSTRYGLAASIWTSHVTRAHRLAARLHSGIVWINCWMLRDLRTPFGGMKDSGVGREGGLEALRFFTDSKNVCVKL